MDQLRAMRIFVRVIDEGGFAKAARALDLAPPVVTRVVAELEAHLGARLLNRTTRRIALTPVGEAWLQRARQILIDVEEAEALASESATEARGTVRLMAPPAVAVHQIAKHLPAFHARHPQVTVELSAPGPVETVDEEHDLTLLAVRRPLAGDFVARRLARSEVVLCASPDYLARRGRPLQPEDLADHAMLVPPLSDLQRGVPFTRFDGETVVVVPPRQVALCTAHIDTNYAAALAGLGIVGLPSFVIEDALHEHALERVLPAWRLFDSTLWLAMPSRRHVPARTRALMDFLIEVFGGEDRDPWLAAAGCETARPAAAPQT